ncbi:glycosyltransferase family 4 protein [Methylocaldum sp. GT1BB]|jgi:glycosyltransferase involved in cell wall biosynthesis|uniref:glycosyltransferase family 4 protein n=1 Tax=Methylocaldum sp. GT1BB TaxID=3438963 RepID=UPI003D9FCD05
MNFPEIVIATLLHPVGETGVQTHFNNFRSYLNQQGVLVNTITPFSYAKTFVYPVFSIRRFIDPFYGPLSVWWYRYWHYFFLRLALRSFLASRKDTVIYAQCPLSAKAALEARLDSSQKVVMIVHFNVSQAEEWRSKGKIKAGDWIYKDIYNIERQILPKVDGLVYISQWMKSVLERDIPDLQKVASLLSPNFCERRMSSSAQLAIYDLINIGTLEPRKNQAFLLEVLAEAKRLGREFSLTLIGDGPDRGKLQQLAVTLDIVPQVRFLGYRKDAADLLPQHRCYVHSALVESFGIVLIEAMACGLPVVAGAVGGIPELYTDGVEGFFWALDDSKAAAVRLIQLLDDRDRCADMGAAAIRRYLHSYTTEAVAAGLLNFLSTVSTDQSSRILDN